MSTESEIARLPEPCNPASRLRFLQVFAGIGFLSFGGPAAQIGLMHRKLVHENKWLDEKAYLNALGFCMLLPGPEAMQLATYAGWRMRGTLGGLVAGGLFILPGAAVILLLSAVYARYGTLPLVQNTFVGIKAAVLIVVFEALLRLSRRALSGLDQWFIAGLAFVGIFFLSLPFPLIILAAGIYGALVGYRKVATSASLVPVHVSLRQTFQTVLLWLLIWLVPLFLLGLFANLPILAEIGTFFSKLAVVTFGGAYAVLAYMAQDIVTDYGWLTAGEMMDGLGMAETTPGPLILVTQFVAFLAADRVGGLFFGVWGACVALWATFVPCFLWIFAGAPYIEWISAQPRLNAAISAITAAVVGVVLNLSVWFALHVLFTEVQHVQVGWLTLWIPDAASFDWRVLLLALAAGLGLLRFHVPLIYVLVFSAVGGIALTVAASSG
ncbi:MAG: chromate efflux transporter [Roseibium sp.]|uniref:chromate efflux transporter n=1 Tax=Roseibium sp. TaxID=1936156 RepID=UPI002602455C|nr:chromate efflux transporter [Roseibium sp.]MCV0424767.1 chromate efflux transporter [Roseibium sp.]